MVNVYGGRDWSAATRDSSNFLGLHNASKIFYDQFYLWLGPTAAVPTEVEERKDILIYLCSAGKAICARLEVLTPFIRESILQVTPVGSVNAVPFAAGLRSCV
jgi:hypothetical protein